MSGKFKIYQCHIEDFFDRGVPLISNVIANTSAKAKHEFHYKHRDSLVSYKECHKFIQCKSLGIIRPEPFFTKDKESFTHMCKRRNISFAYLGMNIDVASRQGWIVGNNSHLNLDVMFKDTGTIHNCHPEYETTYYDEQGGIVKNFKK